MMKKMTALFAATLMTSALTVCAAEFPCEPQFDPAADCDAYTVVEYTIEDLNADLVVTVCQFGEDKYEILTNFFGDDQDWVGTYDGEKVVTESDRTGFMEGDAPAIIAKAIEQNIWEVLGAATESGVVDVESVVEAVADPSAFPAPAQFDPNPEFEFYTVVEYTIEDLNADLVCTVCKQGEDKYDILTNFFGDDQDWIGTYDGEKVVTESDRTGFMEGDAPAIIEKAIEQNIWVPVA